MPPPKAKLHKNPSNGKLKSIGKSETAPPTPADEENVASQFEVELCWCIQQLQLTLDDGKLADRQKADAEKTLKALQNNKQPLIKKRMLMRSTFGDYRTKMADERRKNQLTASKMNIQPVDGAGQKSLLVRKHVAGDISASILAPSDNSFRFNFAVE